MERLDWLKLNIEKEQIDFKNIDFPFQIQQSNPTYFAFLVAHFVREKKGKHLLVFEDKNQAGYMLNNLQVFVKDLPVLFYPASYKVPYQIEKTDNNNLIKRAKVLKSITEIEQGIIVAHSEAICERVPQLNIQKQAQKIIQKGANYCLDELNEWLIDKDFQPVDQVCDVGEFSIRGGILDVFSYTETKPFRIEFFDDEVESIREFDPLSQISISKLETVEIIANTQAGNVQNSMSFLNYFNGKTDYIWMPNIEYTLNFVEDFYNQAERFYQKSNAQIERSPKEKYLTIDGLKQDLLSKNLIFNKDNAFVKAKCSNTYFDEIIPSFNKNIELWKQHLNDHLNKQYACYVFVKSIEQIERLKYLIDDERVIFVRAFIQAGFIDNDHKRIVYTDHQIFGKPQTYRLDESYRKTKQALSIKDLSSLKKGDYIVHIDHGIGQFSGLEHLDINGNKQETIRILYKGGDILYVNVHSLHKISKYSGKEGKEIKVHKLGSGKWAKTKQKAKSNIKKIAFDLIELYAKRKSSKGFAFSKDGYLQNEMEASFIYQDTPDQLEINKQIKRDMESEAPMDRLMCGDVGFGKTELAIRAAFKAVCDGKQVAVLVPTTVLAYQHFKTFTNRLKQFPVEVDYISRFKTSKQINDTLKRLLEGKIDVLIGTHILVNKSSFFKDLGLLVVDEEQKFGVAIKEKLKTFKANLDTLTLSATPIPRTLQFSMMNARDLSMLKTPPSNRFSVETNVRTFSEEVIRDAIDNELSRGGQVYFVHNRIENIKEIAGMVQRLCPDCQVGIGHGQMEAKKLESIVLDFIGGNYDVLVSTTIVESGIDIPNANTIIVNNAHYFGLSDLHQLRGRVGRSNKQAFAYFFAPPKHHLSENAKKRLSCIEEFSDLGEGFQVAMRDLDIRGAGDIFGANQSGFIADIGLQTFNKVLKEAVKELKETEFKTLFKDESIEVDICQLDTDLPLSIPTHYVSNTEDRMALYKSIDSIEDSKQLDAFKLQLKDRFGDIPNETKALLKAVELRWEATKIGFVKIIIKNNSFIGYFPEKTSSYYQSNMFTAVLNFVQTTSKKVDLTEKNDKLYLKITQIKTVEDCMMFCKQLTQNH